MTGKALVIPSQAQLTAAGPNPLTVRQLSDLATQVIQLEDEIAAQSLLLQTLNERLRILKTSTIPSALDEAGVKAMTLPNGFEVEVQEFLAANIKKEDEPRAFAWLRANKAGALIKNEFKVKLGKGDDTIAKKLVAACKKLKIPIERKESVHYQTLQAFVREKLQAGKALPPEINVTKVPTATIHRPKE